MDILELIKQRRAVRAYTNKELKEKDIESILQAGQVELVFKSQPMLKPNKIWRWH